jgi:NAD-dependent SIR2 family protein deacetylase
MECTKELIWKPDLSDIEYDPETFVAKGPFPSCDMCGSLIRPNICLSNDWNFNTTRFVTQQTNYVNWLKNVGDSKLTVIEIGAGTTFPSVRENSESMITKNRAKIIRINPFDNVVQNPSIIPLKMSAKEALIGLMKLMK